MCVQAQEVIDMAFDDSSISVTPAFAETALMTLGKYEGRNRVCVCDH